MNETLSRLLARASVTWVMRFSLLGGLLSTIGCGSPDEQSTTFALADVLARNATCQSTDNRLKFTYTYRADTRVLLEAYESRVPDPGGTSGVFESELDAQGLAIYRQERQNGNVVWRHDYTYDDHGRLTRLSYPPRLIDYVNTYDDAGRLLAVERKDQGTGADSISLTKYNYDGEGRLTAIRDGVKEDGTVERTRTMSYDDGGRRTMVEERYAAAPTVVYRRTKFAYDDQNRLVEATFDGGGLPQTATADGTNTARFGWTYREATDVSRVESDGTDASDGGRIDGTIDQVTSFADGCRAIGVLSPSIYRHPIDAVGP